MKLTNEQIKYKVMTYFSNESVPCCVKCGYSDIRALCLDHVNGDGSVHRKLGGKKGINLYKELHKNDFVTDYEFQVLCANCNMIKFFENKESSHIKTQEWKNKISEKLKSIEKPTGKNAPRARKVMQFTLNKEPIKIWDTIKEAESFYNSNPNAKNIVAVCNGRQTTTYGFSWEHYPYSN